MSIPVSCPGCQAVYPVPENLLGKTIRCKACGQMMPVKAPEPVAADVIEDDEPPRSKSARRRNDDDVPKGKPSRRPSRDEDDEPKPMPKRRPVVAADDDTEDEDEDDDRPSRNKKSKAPLIVGGAIAALVLVGGIAAAVMMGGGKDEDKPNANTQPVAVNTTPTTGPGPTPTATPDPKTEPKVEPKVEPKTETKAEPKPEEPKVTKPPKTGDDFLKPGDAAPVTLPGRGSSTPGRGSSMNSGLSPEAYFNGNISKLTMDQTLRASVFIKTELDTGTATGSGWFGVAPGLVFTNAHVLNMKAPNSPEPKKLTFFLNAGTPQQREIPHAKLKILAVDRDIDLAVIKIVGETDLPSPLKIKLSSDMELGQSVYTVGYPLGYILSQLAKSKKEPEVTVRKTSFIGISTNEYGQVRRVKLESGVNSGNSGGPVVDANGDVTAVVVAITNVPGTGNAISLCVPTEYVDGLMTGRVSDIQYGVPYRDKDKVRIPITANILNPMERNIQVRVRSWVGDTNAKHRTPTQAKPTGEPADTDEQDVELKYDDKAKKATGELVYITPPAGRTYWAQPYYLTGTAVHALPGVKVPVDGPPVDRLALELKAAPKEGAKRVVTMSNSSALSEDFEGEGEAKNDKVLMKKSLTVREQVVKADTTDRRQLARLQLSFDSFSIGYESNGQSVMEISKKEQEQYLQYFKAAAAFGLMNKFGEIYSYTLTVAGVNDPLANLIVNLVASGALEALEATSIPMPNRTLQPMETWDAVKDVRWTLFSRPTSVGGLGGPPTGPGGGKEQKPKSREFKYQDKITYTYLGVRERAGRKEAVISVTGKSVPAPGTTTSVTGGVKGLIWVEPETGAVVQAEIEREFELDTSRDGQKRRLSGVNTYKIDRGPTQ